MAKAGNAPYHPIKLSIQQSSLHIIMALKNFFFATLFVLGLSFLASALASDHDGDQYSPNSKPSLQKLNLEKEKLLSTMIGIQGLIYCRSGSKLTPLAGAVARITCEGVDEYGYETDSLSVLSCGTDAKGYFIATLSADEVKDFAHPIRKFTECKTFLDLSPSEACDVPTDVNNGITGAPLASYRFLHDNNMKLFTVGPFSFIPQQDTKSISADGN